MERQLLDACLNGETHVVRKLLEQDDYSLNLNINYSLNTNNQNQNLDANMKNERNQLFQMSLICACENGYDEIVEILINDKRVDVNLTDQYGDSPLILAFKKGYFKIVERLLNHERIDVNVTDNFNRTIFHYLCSNGKIDGSKLLSLLSLLLKHEKLDVNKVDMNGISPFLQSWNHFEIMKILLNDQKINPNMRDRNGSTAFYLACLNGKRKIVELMLNYQSVDINLGNNEGTTPLMVICGNGRIKMLNLILKSERKIDLDIKNKYGKRAIDFARESSKIGLELELELESKSRLESGLIIDSKNDIQLIKRKNYLLIVKLLEDLENNSNETEFRLWIQKKLELEEKLLASCSTGNLEKVNELLQNYGSNDMKIEKNMNKDMNLNINVRDEDNLYNTPLINAIIGNHVEIVEILLKEKGIEINLRNVHKFTGFNYGCYYGRIEIVKLMLKEEKLDVNKEDDCDFTPFMNASCRGHFEIVQHLLESEKENEMKLEKKDFRFGKTSMDWAIQGMKKQKFKSQTEDEYNIKKLNYSNIVQLLVSFQQNPKQTKMILTRKLLGN